MSGFLNNPNCLCPSCRQKNLASFRTSHGNSFNCFEPKTHCSCPRCQKKHKEVKLDVDVVISKKGGKEMCPKCHDSHKKFDGTPICKYLRTLKPVKPVGAIIIGGIEMAVTMFLHFDEKTGMATFLDVDGRVLVVGCDQLDGIILNAPAVAEPDPGAEE